MQHRTLILSMTLLGFALSGCGEEATSPTTPASVDDQTPDTPPVQVQALTPGFEIGQTWVVGSIYRSLSVKTPEDTLAIDALGADLESAIDIDPLMPTEVVPQDGTEWTSPVFWRFGVINTNYIPEEGPFLELATDTSGQAQPITIIKVVAPKELNDKGISDGLDPVFYLALRESDWRVKGIHYNYKVREGRNTVVLELPEAGSAAPGADMDFFLVDYMMPIFPLTVGDDTIAYGTEGAGKQMAVRKRADDSVEVDFLTAIDNKQITQRWSDGQPWFDFSITDTRRSWRIDEAALIDLLETNNIDFYSNDQFLESAETIAEKFRNRINLNDTLRVEAGTISSRTPETNTPWAGYWFPLTDSATTFGWNGANGRRLLDKGPATSIKSKIGDDLRAIDALMAEILDMPKDASDRQEKIREYYSKKEAIQTTIREHFEHPETGVVAKFRNGELTLDEVNSFGPLEKYGLYLLANKVTDHPFEAAIWEITKQYNPGGESWWGKCNGWAAASILVNEPRESVTMQLDTANITGDSGNVNVDFTSGDLKSLSASAYYGTRSHFYGSRYYGKDDDRGNDLQDIRADVFHRIISFYIGEEKYPLVFDLTASEQVWNYSCYAYDSVISELTRLDPGTAGINTAEKKALENAGISAAAATAIFDRIRSSKGPFARFSEIEELEAVSAQDLDKLRNAAFTLWGDRQAHQVVTDLKCATDGVSEDHLDTVGGDPNGFVKNYTYNLVVADNGTVIRGEWTGDSIEEHPDFAWVPYANEVRGSTDEEWRRHGSYEDYIKYVLNSRYAPSENVFLFTDILDTLIDVRENAPVVCNVDPDDCGEGRVCNPLDGTCEEAPSEPAPADDGCMGSETHTNAFTTISQSTAEAISGKVCSGRDSWFLVALEEGQKAEINISFNHALGDIDMELQQANGLGLAGRSTSTSNSETIIWTAQTTGDHFLRIYGYSGAANEVELTVTIAGSDSEACTEEAGEANNNLESATAIAPGSHIGAICGNDADFYQISEAGSWTFELSFTHAEGDLDVKSHNTSGAQTAISQGTGNIETISGSGPGFIEVYGYNGATGAYSIEFTSP